MKDMASSLDATREVGERCMSTTFQRNPMATTAYACLQTAVEVVACMLDINSCSDWTKAYFAIWLPEIEKHGWFISFGPTQSCCKLEMSSWSNYLLYTHFHCERWAPFLALQTKENDLLAEITCEDKTHPEDDLAAGHLYVLKKKIANVSEFNYISYVCFPAR